MRLNALRQSFNISHEYGFRNFDFQHISRRLIFFKQRIQFGEFVLYLQPKIHMETGALIGAEALVRWIRKDGTIIPVEQFLPSFEKNGFITKVDFEISALSTFIAKLSSS